MNRKLQVISSLILLLLSWLSIGISFMSKIGHPLNTLLLILGLIGIFTGFIWFIVSAKSNKK